MDPSKTRVMPAPIARNRRGTRRRLVLDANGALMAIAACRASDPSAPNPLSSLIQCRKHGERPTGHDREGIRKRRYRDPCRRNLLEQGSKVKHQPSIVAAVDSIFVSGRFPTPLTHVQRSVADRVVRAGI